MHNVDTLVYRAKRIANDASKAEKVQYELSQMRLRPHRL
jgi:hypothetical protein